MQTISSKSPNKREPSRNIPADCKTDSVVYFVQIGKRVKIGWTINLERRLKTFATGHCERMEVILTIPGGRAEETRLHRLLADNRIRGEFFYYDGRMEGFICRAEKGNIAAAWQWLEDMHPSKIKARAEEARRARIEAARRTRAEESAYYDGLVAARKRTLGW